MKYEQLTLFNVRKVLYLSASDLLSKEEKIKAILLIYNVTIADLACIDLPENNNMDPGTRELYRRIARTVQSILDEED